MSHAWQHQLAAALVADRPYSGLSERLDALLLWLGNPANPRARVLDEAMLAAGLDRRQARARAYLMLDRALFEAGDADPAALLGLDAAALARPAALKQRYRRMMQVYHPDHHPMRTAWATERTERINRAHARLRAGEAANQSERTQAAPPAPSGPVLKRLKQWLKGQDARRRVRLPGAVALLAMIALIVYLGAHRQAPTPQPRIIDIPLEQWLAERQDRTAPAPRPPQSPAPDSTTHQAQQAPTPPSEPATTPTPQQQPKTAPKPQLQIPLTPEPDTEPVESVAQSEPADASATAPSAPTPQRHTRQHPATLAPTFPPGWLTGIVPPIAATTPPAPPERPLVVRPGIATPSLPISDSCREVGEALVQFQTAYQNGKLGALMTLYSPLAKENQLGTWFAIRQTYSEWFRTTFERSIEFAQPRIKPLANGRRCAAQAAFRVRYQDAAGETIVQDGVIEWLFEQTGEGLRILRVRY